MMHVVQSTVLLCCLSVCDYWGTVVIWVGFHRT